MQREKRLYARRMMGARKKMVMETLETIRKHNTVRMGSVFCLLELNVCVFRYWKDLWLALIPSVRRSSQSNGARSPSR